MATELKATVINMKTLSQDIPDPIVVGAADVEGRSLRIIFTQEAAAQFTEGTKVYLSWWHQEKNIKGYNVFTEITNDEEENFPPTWEIHYPKSMLYDGHVLACIEIVDDVSIATSVNFIIHVLIDPNDGSDFIASSDYSEFQKAIIQLASVEDQARAQLDAQEAEFENMREIVISSQDTAVEAKEIAENALEVANEALEATSDLENYVTKDQLANFVTEDILQDYTTSEEVNEKIQIITEDAQNEHQSLWNALQIVDLSDDNEEG